MAKNIDLTIGKTYQLNYRGEIAVGIVEAFSAEECVLKTEKRYLIIPRVDVIGESLPVKKIGRNMGIWEHKLGLIILTSDLNEDENLTKRGFTKTAVKYMEIDYSNGEGL